jgi:hypothetical protein
VFTRLVDSSEHRIRKFFEAQANGRLSELVIRERIRVSVCTSRLRGVGTAYVENYLNDGRDVDVDAVGLKVD